MNKENLIKILELVKVLLLALIAWLSSACASTYSVQVKQNQPDQEQNTTITTTTTISGADFFKR